MGMSVAEVPGCESAGVDGEPVRDLLRRCGATSDHAERAELLIRIADELERAAREIAAVNPGEEVRATVAALHGQAGMARFMAELDRGEWARHLERTSDRSA
jgi:acyl-CoA reductase-like NAD-dependent aldehyde dehydrogenase